MRAISLFSGAGGMDIGMTQAGFQVVAANELDKDACNTYRLNNPEINLYQGDIEEQKIELYKYSNKNIGVVFGGPPCQGFSVAGKMDLNDPRSKLIFSFVDIVEKIQPKAFIMENVKSLATLDKFKDVRHELYIKSKNTGYNIFCIILNSKDFGVPQSRERAFFIGFKDINIEISINDFFDYYEKPLSLRDTIKHLGRAGSANNKRITNAKITLAEKPILRNSPYAGMLFNGQGRPLNPDGWSSTLPASMGGNRTPIIDEDHLYDDSPSWVEEYHQQLLTGNYQPTYKEAPSRLRRLTIDEAILIQTFPKNYSFTGSASKIFTQIVNAVPCKLSKVVGLAVKQKLENN